MGLWGRVNGEVTGDWIGVLGARLINGQGAVGCVLQMSAELALFSFLFFFLDWACGVCVSCSMV